MTSTPSSRRSFTRRTAVGLAALALAVSACGSSDAPVSVDATSEAAGDASTSDGDSGATAAEPQQTSSISVEGEVLLPFESGIADPAIGVTAPVLSGESFDGTPVVVGGPTDNPTLVVFLAHWCPHCNDEIPELLSLAVSGDLPEGLDVIGVSTAADPSAENYPPSEWIVEKGWRWPTMADDENLTAINAMGGTSFPFTVVLDSDGTVLARRAGAATADVTTAFLADALAG